MDIQQAKELLRRYHEGKCTPQENEVIETWYNELIKTGELQWNEGEKAVMQQILEARIMKQLNAEQDNNKQIRSASTISFSPRFHWWAAASVVFLLGVAGYFLVHVKKAGSRQVAKVKFEDVKAPQLSKALITFANGQKIYLDSLHKGGLSMPGSVKLVKLPNGEIAYQQTAGEATGQMKYNTLSNPRGSKVINMILADGSKVWLNAGSSLTYPVSFHSKERKVCVTGEAYFEVFHDASKPFVVSNGSMNIKVLGTHFNVNAFHDNGDTKVTLLQGSVKINNGNASGILKPGEQASVTTEIKIQADVDVDEVMAWKNGYFQFNNASLQSVLKEISRWYDVDVLYEGSNRPRAFAGEMQRDLSLSEVLKILERNKVNFRIEGKKLIVLPD
jgi:ferric-dicitrate binding protein FerR (iron transport regulator)